MMENAKRFFEELDENEKAQELLKSAALEESAEDALVLAKAARETGYDVTDEDMRNLLSALQKQRAVASDSVAEQIVELRDEELDAVAGGKDHRECKETFKDSESCWWEDSCKNFVNMYSDGDNPYRDNRSLRSGVMLKPDCKIGRFGL